MTTEQEARDMRDALKLLEQKEAQQQQLINQAKIQVAIDWWNTVKPSIPLTRDEALTAYRFIEELLNSETDEFRLQLLRNKLQLANEKFKERKRNG